MDVKVAQRFIAGNVVEVEIESVKRTTEFWRLLDFNFSRPFHGLPFLLALIGGLVFNRRLRRLFGQSRTAASRLDRRQLATSNFQIGNYRNMV